MIFILGLIILLDAAALCFPPLLIVAIPVTYLYVRVHREASKLVREDREAKKAAKAEADWQRAMMRW